MTTHQSGTTRPGARQGRAPLIAVLPDAVESDRHPLIDVVLGAIKSVVLYVIVPLALLLLGAAAVGYVWLMHTPVPLKSFSDQIEQRINASLGGFKADIDDASLAVSSDRGIELRLKNLRLKEADGDAVVSAPEAAVKLSRAALWRLDATPERIYLIKPRLAVVYSETSGFSLSMANAGDPAAPDSASPASPAASEGGKPAALHAMDIRRLLASAAGRAGGDGAAGSPLRKFGVLEAIVSVTDAGRTSEIRVDEAAIDLDHSGPETVISGEATISAPDRPWHLGFRMEGTGTGDAVKVFATVDHFVPSSLARAAPRLALLSMLDTPLAGNVQLDLSSEGQIRAGTLDMSLGRGHVRLPSVSNTPLLLDGGRVSLAYDAAARKVSLSPSTLQWAESRITLEGAVTREGEDEAAPQWHFRLQSVDGTLAAEEFSVPPMPVEGVEAAGRIIPSEGLLQLSDFQLRAGGGEVRVNGEVINAGGRPSTRIEAAITPMPLETLKAIWPRAMAPAARDWVGERVTKATLRSASFKLLSGRFLDPDDGAGSEALPGAERISASIEIEHLSMTPLPKSLPLEAKHALIRMENGTLEVNVPDAAIIASPEHRLPLTGVRLTIVDVRQSAPIAELALKSEATLPTLIETLNRSQLHLAGHGPLPIDGVDGKVHGEIKIAMPLVDDASVVKATGKARVFDLKGKSKDYGIDLQSGTITVDVSDAGVIANGDMMINGVLAKLHMHRLLNAEPEAQPPLRITALLDNADRNQLGLDVNHIVQGNVPVEIAVSHQKDGAPRVHVRANLAEAELLFSGMAWRKPPGRSASLDFDLEAPEPGHVDLKNFKLVGDNIAIDGWAVVDAKREVREFHFPNFSINVVSRLDVRGTMNDKRIWTIAAKGATFDAKDVFRSMLALSKQDAVLKARHPPAGVDFAAEIDTLMGNSEVSLRKAKLKVSERNDKIVSIEADGTYDDGHPVMMELKPGGRRVVFAKSSDAGQTLKLIGLYPNIKGGHMELEVDLDGRDAADMVGLLTIDNFRVLGDPIVSEVYSSAEAGQSGEKPRAAKRAPERQVFEFQRMQVPFSSGHGQFVLDDSYLRGPLMGASIRGRVDFNARRVNLGGTYVPLQGINAAVCDIPLFGPIVAGFDCQGVFGITYAIQGPMEGPEVIVNPLSMFTPGILRGIMELTSPNPQVQQRPAEQRNRAPAGADRGPAVSADGWSSETRRK